jgi:hypothetical protein
MLGKLTPAHRILKVSDVFDLVDLQKCLEFGRKRRQVESLEGPWQHVEHDNILSSFVPFLTSLRHPGNHEVFFVQHIKTTMLLQS